MKKYIGAKIIGAELSTFEEYKKNKYGENAIINADDNLVIGYIVTYPGIGDNKENYCSWSPKEVFEKAYR